MKTKNIMPAKDLHDKPFDQGTIAKLEIFEAYAQEWIPTWVMQSTEEIHIFDFFAGPGFDCEGVDGTPIRLLKKILGFKGNLFQKGTKVVLHLNEFNPKGAAQQKYEELVANCNNFLVENKSLKSLVTIKYYNKDAADLFFELLPYIHKYPSLVFFDQNGIKFISEKYIKALEEIDTLDFLYFVSSSYFKWLGTTPEFQRVLDFSEEKLQATSQKEIHRAVISKIREKLPEKSELKLFPYSIKKGANIYGIIFGAKHLRAVDKFLRLAWKNNTINGEANFDIDEEKGYQHDMFEQPKLSKIESFQRQLETKLLSGELTNNKEVYLFTLSKGHLPDHAVKHIKSLKKKLSYEGRSPRITYNNVVRDRLIVNFQILK